VLSPERIVIGGGVLQQPRLISLVQREVTGLLNGYLDAAPIRDAITEYITTPALGVRAGVLGAIALAATA
jgi:fructokinase